MNRHRFLLGSVVLAITYFVAPASPSWAETFYLTDGRTVEGTVVRRVGPMLSIKLTTAGVERVRFEEIERVEFETPAGDRISAQITGWSKGVYKLLTEQGPVEASVEGGRLVSFLNQRIEDAGDRPPTAEPRPTATPEPAPAIVRQEQPASDLITAGFVLVGRADDGGRNFMLDKGRRQLADDPRVDETMILEIESDDDARMSKALDELVGSGANLIFITGGASSSSVMQSAQRHADVRFVHCGPFRQAANVDVFCGRIYQARYLSGIIAGGMTETDLIGYVAAEPTSDTIVGINAFALGAQSLNPNAVVMVHWTTSQYAPSDARLKANELIERGVDVLTIHQDSPAALQIAEQRGVSAIGYQSDMSAFAPSTILTSVVWDWGEMYGKIVDQLTNNTSQLRPTWLGLREGVVGLAPISDRVPEDLTRTVEQRRRELTEGRFNVFTGPIRDVDGDVRVLAGRIITDKGLQSMDYLVEGVVGY